MSRLTPITPDAMPLREALRGLRFMLRRGGETLVETLGIDTLPKPAADLAGAVMRPLEEMARTVDIVTSGMAKSVLGGAETPATPLRQMLGGRDAASHFAAACYVALTSVLRRLGTGSVFVSEGAARLVFARISAGDPEVSTARQAANLTLSLLEAKVIRGTTAQDAARVHGAAVEPVAIFAVMLWLQSDRSEAENEAALDAATDMAVALAADVADACAHQDADRLQALYARYVAHV